MEIFIKTMFWIHLICAIGRIAKILDGSYKEPRKLEVFAVDTVITATFAIWAGFILWY